MSVPGDTKMAKELHEWGIKVMHFNQTQLPNVDAFKPLCRGQLNDVWNYVTTHVRPFRTVRLVKGNLKIQKMQLSQLQNSKTVETDASKLELITRKRELLAELSSVVTATQVLEHDVERLRNDIDTAEQSYQATVSQINGFHCQAALLTSYSRLAMENVARFDEFTRQVNQKAEVLANMHRKCTQPVVMVSRNVAATESSSDSSVETRSLKTVRETCQSVAEFLHQLLHGSFENNDIAMSRSREELFKRVEASLTDISAVELLVALCQYSDEAASSLVQKTAAVDVVKDAKMLRFKYESNGRFSDTSTPPSMLQSIHQLLEIAQSEMFVKFIETEKHRNSGWTMEKRLNEASAAIDDKLRHFYSSNPSAYQLAKRILEVETRIAGSQASLETLNKFSSDFAVKISQITADKQTLYAKYQKIQDFKKLSEIKQNLIRILVKQNMNAKSKLITQQSENVEYAKRTLNHRETEIQQFSEYLKNSILAESDSFVKLPSCLLPTVVLPSGQRIAVVELSIYRLDNIPHTQCRQTVTNLLTSFDVPSFIAPELLMSRIADSQTDHGNTTTLTRRLQRCKDTNVLNIVADMTKLHSSMEQHDEELSNRLLPIIKQRLAKGTRSLSDCLEIKDIVVNWWEQPARDSTPWITVDGLNMQQWFDRWTVAATRLRQLSSTKR